MGTGLFDPHYSSIQVIVRSSSHSQISKQALHPTMSGTEAASVTSIDVFPFGYEDKSMVQKNGTGSGFFADSESDISFRNRDGVS
jgi:hypothetical protein